jgi:hypothetical protein
MTQAQIALQQTTIIVIGGYTDAPGFKIVSDGHGGFKIVPIPGWNPELAAELSSTLQIAARAGAIKETTPAQTILNTAANLAVQQVAKLAGGDAGAQGTTIVVVAS